MTDLPVVSMPEPDQDPKARLDAIEKQIEDSLKTQSCQKKVKQVGSRSFKIIESDIRQIREGGKS